MFYDVRLLLQTNFVGDGVHWPLSQVSFRNEEAEGAGSYPGSHLSLIVDCSSKVTFVISSGCIPAFSVVVGLVHCPRPYGEGEEN